MKGFGEMREIKINHGIHGTRGILALAVLGMAWSANAATGTSPEFRVDLAGMGPWEMRTARASEAISYSSAWATNAMSGANAVVKVWPVKREKPKYIAIDLSGGSSATHYPIEYLDEIPGGTWSDEYKTSKLVLRHIPAGSFIMGGRATDYPGASNTNLHMVTLTKDFYIGVFEVTQRQWELVMGNRPSAFSNETCYAARPVEMVSYVDIRGGVKGVKWPESRELDETSFMGKLRKRSGVATFDLPTESQWEYACRAGTTTAYNSGKNLEPDLAPISANANEVARYWGNSGGYDSLNDSAISVNKACSSDEGTAMVGSYLENAYGLYDMHGNVWEFCLDAITNVCASGSIDPVGNDSRLGWRVYRGGSYMNSPGGIRSANRWTATDTRPFGGWQENEVWDQIGFRLCLQGGELPELNDGTVLVNAAGEGTTTWTPAKAGTYYLTHETQTNGVNGAEVLGAWFEVAGPELAFAPDGDLTPGVKIAINGAGEGWTARYTTDGTAPTSDSPEYTGPITLNDSATIRAIAISDGGIESREFSATYSLMSVVGAVAKPRYPWNGKVDIDCEMKGDANLDYLISLAALDLDGNTNLPVRTVAVAQERDPPVNGAFGGRILVKPGQYRFTWDADADIAGDFDFANVAVKVSAEGSAIVAAKKVLSLEVAGYTGTETLANVPVLVRLSTAIAGFSYADFADANGGDLIFTDESGSVVYPHEIDEWHVGGESLVWVKLPVMANGTKFKAAWGGGRGATALPAENGRAARPLAAAVWSDYAGVWHFNEDSGTAFDSTEHGLDALPSNGTNDTAAALAYMIACDNGACGRARVNCLRKTRPGNYMTIPSYNGLGLEDHFYFSGWFRGEGYVIGTTVTRLASRKQDTAENGWEISCYDYNYVQDVLSGSAGGSANTNGVRFVSGLGTESWSCISACYSGDNVLIYTNGTIAAAGHIDAASDNGRCLYLGAGFGGWGPSFLGQYDEIRLRGGSLSADRIKADYDMIKNRNFLSYGPVESGRGTE